MQTVRFALVKFGGGIVQASGSIAGVTHARNRFGNYIRARTKPVNPNTARQDLVRSALAELTVRWSATLTAAQRTAWNLYASNVAMTNRLGETIHLTGSNHYIRSNAMLTRLGLANVDAGPVVFELPAQDPAYSITASEATQQITHAFDNTLDWATETGAKMYLFQGRPQNAQRNFFGGPWGYIGLIDGIDPGGAVTPWVGGVLFPIAEGQRQWTYARIMRADGRLSQIFRDDTFVAA